MNNLYTYHFSLHLSFKKDVDVKQLEKSFGVKAYKLTFLKDSKGDDEHKSAKIWYKSPDYNEVFVDEKIEQFTTQMFDNFKDLKSVLDEFDGRCSFSLIFTQTKERPVIALTRKTIEMFAKLGLDFDVDFV